jgi:hypothetical protein
MITERIVNKPFRKVRHFGYRASFSWCLGLYIEILKRGSIATYFSEEYIVIAA